MAENSPQAGTETGVAAIVLAAGKSTRMRSKLPKALHPISGRPSRSYLGKLWAKPPFPGVSSLSGIRRKR